MLAAGLERALIVDEVALDEPLLAFDAERGGLVLSGTKLSIEKDDETHLIIENFSISANPEAVLDKFIFAPHTFEAENVTAIFLAENIQRTENIQRAANAANQPSSETTDKADTANKADTADKVETTDKTETASEAETADKTETASEAETADKAERKDKVETANEFDPAAAFSALQNRLAQTHFIGGKGRSYLNYLQTAKLPNVTLAFRDYNNKGDKIWHSTGSYILFDKLNGKINASLHFELYSGRERSVLDFTLSQPFAESGEALLRVNNIRLSSLGLFFPSLPFLAQANVPVNGAIAFFTNAEGAFTAGATDLQLSKGTIHIGDEDTALRTAKTHAKV
ncbi:MAG: hypothetical protein OXU76_04460, partial [Alphaproteobacteria bacterium]|nr:hypothetical protein [Alphaproteobacteria bacterium]